MNERLASSAEGISVSINDAHIALRGLAEVYSRYAQVRGFQEGAASLEGRRELARQYGRGWRRAIGAALENAKNALNEAERLHMPVLTKEAELAGAGFEVKIDGEAVEVRFDPTDAETEALRTIIAVRRAIGTQVGAKTREKSLSGLYSSRESKKAS